MIKKLVSSILVIAIFASIVAFASDKPAGKQEIAVDVITQLGFIEADAVLSDEVTRAEFSTIALKLYNEEPADEFSEGVDTPYGDVLKEHYKSADITSCYTTGIMRGYSDGNFYPEKIVLYQEAVKVIMDLLGYKDYASVKGGFPLGYTTLASSMGITSGVKNGYTEGITFGELARLIYNAMDVPVLEISGITDGALTLEKQGQATFLSKYHDMYMATGTVDATPITRRNGASLLENSSVEINGEKYVSGVDGINTLVGMNVQYYYEKTGNEDGTVVCAVPVDNEILDFFGDDIIAASSNGLRFIYDNGSEEEVRFAENGDVIYNGVYVSKVINYDFKNLVDISGKVRIVDTNDDGKYDLILVTEYVNYVVSTVVADDDTILLKDKSSNTQMIELDKRTYSYIEKNGVSISLSEIEKGNLVSVAMSSDFATSPDRRYIEIVVSSQYVMGTPTAISEKEEITLTYLEGRTELSSVYKISGSIINEKNATIKIGNSGQFHIDALGEIGYYVAPKDVGMRYGYIIHAGEEGNFSNFKRNYGFKVLEASGQVAYYFADDKLKIDGYPTESDKIDQKLTNTSPFSGQKRQLVRYELNEEGLISNIDTTGADKIYDPKGLDSNTDVSVTQGITYINAQKAFFETGTFKRFFMTDDIKVFVVPKSSAASDKDYAVRSIGRFIDNQVYGSEKDGEVMILHTVDDSEPSVIEVQTSHEDTTFGGINQYDAEIAVVMEKSSGINKEGEERVFVKIMVNNAEKTLLVDPESTRFLRVADGGFRETTTVSVKGSTLTAADYNFGDCILFYEDDNGETSTLVKMNDYELWNCSKNGEQKYTTQLLGSYLERIYGSVRNINGTRVTLDISSESGEPLRTNMIGAIKFYLVDTESKKVTTASLGDIIYSEDDGIADKVFVRTRNHVIKQVVIYR